MRMITRDIGGSALSRAALAGELPAWYGASIRSQSAWYAVAHEAAARFESDPWLERLMPALQATGAAAGKLEAAATGGGLVVTGGQQPGLFGGPLYVLYKAITLAELARALESITSLPVAPIFWAATDDADFVEASHVSVVTNGHLEHLAMMEPPTVGLSMAQTPLGDVSALLDRLRVSCGTNSNPEYLLAVRAAYDASATVGSAYVQLLRAVLAPLGVAVLDAAHTAVREAGHATIKSALVHAEAISDRLKERGTEISNAGYRPQVAHVPNLSLVFETLDDGTRRRVPIRDAASVAAATSATRLGPNVLLRPVMERQILPTATYVGGPGEIAYFAQVSAVAAAVELSAPRIVPRWSGTFVESEVNAMLDRVGATVDDFADPHAIEGRVARSAVSPTVRAAMDEVRRSVASATERMRGSEQTTDALARCIGTMQAGVEHRLARLERRYAAAIKQAGTDELRDVAHVRAALVPDGAPQERVLGFIPFLARHGVAFLDSVRIAARKHADRIVQGD